MNTLLTDKQLDEVLDNSWGNDGDVYHDIRFKLVGIDAISAQDAHTKSLLADEVRKMIKKESKHFNTDVFNALQAVLKLMEGK